jgi:hypothetical protein
MSKRPKRVSKDFTAPYKPSENYLIEKSKDDILLSNDQMAEEEDWTPEEIAAGLNPFKLVSDQSMQALPDIFS